MIFLKENGIDSYDDLLEKTKSAAVEFSAINACLKEIEALQKHIAELQKQIGTYGKMRDIYAKYKVSGWDRGFYDIHAADIILHRAAKNYFDTLKMKKLPSIASLKQEYAELAAERKKLYGNYHKIKDSSRELSTVCANTEHILGINQLEHTNDFEHEQAHCKSHER